MLRKLSIITIVLLFCFVFDSSGLRIEAIAEDTAGKVAEVTSQPVEHITFFGLLQASGVIGYIIIFLSFVAVAIVIEFLLTVRRGVLMPKDLADNILQQLTQGQLGAAIQSCNDNSSLLAKVLVAGMKGFEFGWDEVEKGAEDAMEKEASKLYRKIEYLNVIGNIAPMLGLLGTVVGMIIAFQQLAESGGAAKPTDLAQGIYLALVTTVEGLIVALPALGFHSILAGRIATLVSETANTAEQILTPIKRSFLKKK
ncbi:MAG: MotA/TolQ/ExbB proton channel family protein [Planctomycetaceae bacterium]|jgi:biopolymer transport protein ExbB|nr:MotA/TolQ/ExbB proton channel family protein [Planctomycetaceae bacterium]